MAALAAIGLPASLPNRVRYGINGVTSNGIFSRSAMVPTGLLLINSSLSFHGSSFTRPPIGNAAIICGFCLGSAAAVDFRSAIAGTRSPRCALIRLGISFCAILQRGEEKRRVSKLILVRRVVQQLDGFCVGGRFLCGCAPEPKMPESILIIDQQLIEEGKVGVHAMPKNDVSQLMRDNCRQARFVWQNIYQAAAQHDGVAQRKRLQGRGHQYPAANIRLNVQIVGDLQVVHHGFEYLVHFTFRGQQTDTLQTIGYVFFRLPVPRALRLYRCQIVRRSSYRPAPVFRPGSC